MIDKLHDNTTRLNEDFVKITKKDEDFKFQNLGRASSFLMLDPPPPILNMEV